MRMSLKPKPSEPRRKLIVNEAASLKLPQIPTLAMTNFHKYW